MSLGVLSYIHLGALESKLWSTLRIMLLNFCLGKSVLTSTPHSFFLSHMPYIRFQSCSSENAVNHSPIELIHGDFLKHSAVKDAVADAGLVFLNNPNFGPVLNLKILSQ